MAYVTKLSFVDETEVRGLGHHRNSTDVRIFHRTSENGNLMLNIYSNGERSDHPENLRKASQNLGLNRGQCEALYEYLADVLGKRQ